jgi:hypothetical protein
MTNASKNQLPSHKREQIKKAAKIGFEVAQIGAEVSSTSSLFCLILLTFGSGVYGTSGHEEWQKTRSNIRTISTATRWTTNAQQTSTRRRRFAASAFHSCTSRSKQKQHCRIRLCVRDLVILEDWYPTRSFTHTFVTERTNDWIPYYCTPAKTCTYLW